MKKRLLSLAMAICLVLSLLPASAFAAEIVDSGAYGENLTWTLDSDGVVTISGEGPMADFGYDAPLRTNTDIRAVVVEPGVTSIGHYAFDQCSNLERVELPDGVTSIGNYAFRFCSRLKDIALPDSVTVRKRL